MANRKKRAQRGRTPSSLSELLSQSGSDVTNGDDLPDEMKMSAKLLDIMDPWIGEMDLVLLADCASIAWNACVDSVDDYSSHDYLSGTRDDRSGHRDLIEQLKRRKNELHPNDLRTIIRIQVVKQEDGGMRLNVASEMKPQNMMKAFRNLMSTLPPDEDDGE